MGDHSKSSEGKFFAHSEAEIHPSAQIGEGTKIWARSHIRENVVIGKNCNVGEGVYIGPGVTIGDNCKIQNLAQIFDPAVLESGVFIGPGAILTNDKNPRATIGEDGASNTFWDRVAVHVRAGASVGAGAICVAPVNIGAQAMIGAGSVVIHDVSDNTTVVGNPARPIGTH